MRAQREHLFYFLQQAQSQQRGQNSKLGDVPLGIVMKLVKFC